MKNIPKTIWLVFFILVSPALLGAQSSEKVAFVSLENQTGDGRFGYLAPVIEGLLLYDLTEKGGAELVERRMLQNILAEQEFQKSGISDAKSAVRFGKIANARYLVYGGYSLVNGEVVLNIQLSDVQTGETSVIRERGATEHVVHHTAEKLIKKLNGRVLVLADSTNNRSLVSLRDETPGTLALHSRIIGAKIFIDEEFAGFTKGDEKTALVFENLPPGQHKVRTYLADTFGVFEIPSLKFKDWETTVDIKPGRQTAVIDGTMAFYDAIAKIEMIGSFAKSVPEGKKELLVSDKTMEYTTPDGKLHRVHVTFVPEEKADGYLVGNFTINVTGQPEKKLIEKVPYPTTPDRRTERKVNLGNETIQLTFYNSSKVYTFRWEIERNDLDPDVLGRDFK